MKKTFLLLSLTSLMFLANCNNSNPPVAKKFTIKFVNGDAVLQTSEVEEGTLPIYEGDTPSKVAPSEHEYVYTGWDKPIKKATENATYQATFDYVFLFGTYPQTLVTDDDLIIKLKEPHEKDNYGYFVYNDKTYYEYVSEQGYVADDGTRVKVNDEKYKYYEVKPIQWTILDEGEKFYTTYKLLDTCNFYTTKDENESYPNKYDTSELRSYLNSTDNFTNGGFKWRAFREDDLSRINKPEIDNSAKSTGDEPNDYACDNIKDDQIFSLSRQELRDPKYGFNKKDNVDIKRTAKSSEYARARNATLYTDNTSTYWTRSPSAIELGSYIYNVYNVLCDGAISFNKTDMEGRCIRPAIKLS